MVSLKISQLYQLTQITEPNEIALRAAEKNYTFAEVSTQVEIYSSYLIKECQLKPGQRVALYDQKSVAQTIMIFAIWRAGGVVVMINPTLKAAQVEHILRDSAASALVTSAARADSLGLQQALPPTLSVVVTTDRSWQKPSIATSCIEEWQASGPVDAVVRKPDDLAALMYTSGSTGLPKGVMLSQKNILLGADSVAQYLNLSAKDRVLALLPFSFDYGLNQLLSSWYAGASVVLHNFFLPAAVGKELADYHISVLAGVPPLWRQVLAKLQPEQLSHLRLVTNSGGAMTTELIASLQKLKPELAIYSMYGLTEAFRSSYLPPEHLEQKPRSVGQAIPHARLMVLDRDLRACYSGEPGELVHAGELVALGYWQKPEQTAERFIELPEYVAQYPGERAVLSGDLAYMDSDGDLFILGRKDEQIKTSGYRVSPQEVEEMALSIEGVEQAACFGILDPDLGQAIAIVIQGDGITETAFRSQYQVLAANYLWPKYLLHYEELPLNANGKVDRPKLKREVVDEINLD